MVTAAHAVSSIAAATLIETDEFSLSLVDDDDEEKRFSSLLIVFVGSAWDENHETKREMEMIDLRQQDLVDFES